MATKKSDTNLNDTASPDATPAKNKSTLRKYKKKSEKTIIVEKIMAELTRTKHLYIPGELSSEIKYFEASKVYVRRGLFYKSLEEIKAYRRIDLENMIMNAMLNNMEKDATKKEDSHGKERKV